MARNYFLESEIGKTFTIAVTTYSAGHLLKRLPVAYDPSCRTVTTKKLQYSSTSITQCSSIFDARQYFRASINIVRLKVRHQNKHTTAVLLNLFDVMDHFSPRLCFGAHFMKNLFQNNDLFQEESCYKTKKC